MSVQKPLTHLATAHSREQMASRLANYFSDDCPSIPMSGDDGRRALLATRLSMNYGFAYRMATYSALRSIAKSTLGATTNLVVDSPHNSVYEEEVNGAPAFVHRHNACRHFTADMITSHPALPQPGQPFCCPVPTGRRSSVRACSSYRSLTRPPRLRGIIRSSAIRPVEDRSTGRTTAKYRYDGAAPADVPHLDDNGVNEALGILTGHGSPSRSRMRRLPF
jgi:hypothetical protein